MIITLELLPGKALSEQDLMGRLNTGRTPLRDAILRLATEGLVEVLPRQGTFVAGVNVADLRSIMESRLHLEPYAAYLAAKRATPAEWDAMHHLLQEPILPDDPQQYKVDLAFHRTVNLATQNRQMATFLESLQVQTTRFFRHLHATRQPLAEIRAEHQQLLHALQLRDAEAASLQARKHIEESQARLMAALSLSPFQDGRER